MTNLSRTHAVWASIVAVLSGLVVALAIPSQSDANSGPQLKVAMVDIGAVLSDSQISKDCAAYGQQYLNQIQLDRREAHIKDLDTKEKELRELEQQPMASEVAKERLQRSIRELENRIEVEDKKLNATLAEMRTTFTSWQYAGALAVIKDYAKAGNFDLVMRKVNLRGVDSGSVSDETEFRAQSLFSSNLKDAPVIYFGDPTGRPDYAVQDITQEVKDVLATRTLRSLKPEIEKILGTPVLGGIQDEPQKPEEDEKAGD